jgi:hypothetical protein
VNEYLETNVSGISEAGASYPDLPLEKRRLVAAPGRACGRAHNESTERGTRTCASSWSRQNSVF